MLYGDWVSNEVYWIFGIYDRRMSVGRRGGVHSAVVSMFLCELLDEVGGEVGQVGVPEAASRAVEQDQ